MRVLFICVNYFTEAPIQQLAQQLSQLQDADEIELLVVDNGRRWPEGELQKQLHKLSSKFSYVDAGSNLGYFGGAQFGWLRYSAVQSSLPDFVVITNPDIQIRDIGFWQKLKTTILAKNTFILAPQIISTLTAQQLNPHLQTRPSSNSMRWRKLILGNLPMSMAWHAASFIKAKYRSTSRESINGPRRAIYAPHGSFIIFTQKYLKAGGDFRHGAFLYGEELTIAEFTRRHQGLTEFIPELQVFHDEHVATGVFPKPVILRHIAQSIRYTSREYFGV